MKKIPVKTRRINTALPDKPITPAGYDALRIMAFDSASQANIILKVDSGKIIVANDSACRLLGYTRKELITKNISAIFNISSTSFKKKLKQALHEGRVSAVMEAIKKRGKRFPAAISFAFFYGVTHNRNAIISIADRSQGILAQINIDSKKEKIVAADIMTAKSKQKKIDTKNETIVATNILIAKSRQKRIDTQNETIVAANISIAKSKQKKIDTKNETIVATNILIAKSKQKKIDTKNETLVAANISIAISKQKKIDIENETLVATNILIAKSNQKRIDTQNETIVAANILIAKSKQKKIDIKNRKTVADNIIAAQAKSDKEMLKQETASKSVNTKNFKLYFNSSSDVLFDSDLITNEVLVSDAYEKDFGYKVSDTMSPAEDWGSHIHPEDKEAVMQDYNRMLESKETEWKYNYRFVWADNTIASVISRRFILRTSTGKAYRMIGSMQDISKQKALEERLAVEIAVKEKQIEEAAEDAKETERSDLGRELHDNVNQLLSVSKLYLDMARHGGENSEVYVNRSSEYTISAIEEIRKLSSGLTKDRIKDFGLREAIKVACSDIMQVSNVKINCSFRSFAENNVSDKFKHSVYRIVQEQLTNILKHASATTVSVTLSQNKDVIRLLISDNGVGFDTGLKRRGIGVGNIKSRAAYFKGTADFVSAAGKGCVLTVNFPIAARYEK